MTSRQTIFCLFSYFSLKIDFQKNKRHIVRLLIIDAKMHIHGGSSMRLFYSTLIKKENESRLIGNPFEFDWYAIMKNILLWKYQILIGRRDSIFGYIIFLYNKNFMLDIILYFSTSTDIKVEIGGTLFQTILFILRLR